MLLSARSNPVVMYFYVPRQFFNSTSTSCRKASSPPSAERPSSKSMKKSTSKKGGEYFELDMMDESKDAGGATGSSGRSKGKSAASPGFSDEIG